MFTEISEAKIKSKIKIAIDKNIIVYDSNATYGEITERLVALMKGVMFDNYKNKIARIYISSKVITQVRLEKKFINRFTRENPNPHILDIPFIVLDKDYTDYCIIDEGCCLPDSKCGILLAENEDETIFLLGSY